MTAGKRAGQSGFTLIELIITLLIMGVLATIAVPGFRTLITGNHQAASYNDILNGFKLARSEAITRREAMTARLEPRAGGGWDLVVRDAAGETTFVSSSDRVSLSDTLEVTFTALGRRSPASPCAPDDCHVTLSGQERGEPVAFSVSSAGRIGPPLQGGEESGGGGEENHEEEQEDDEDESD